MKILAIDPGTEQSAYCIWPEPYTHFNDDSPLPKTPLLEGKIGIVKNEIIYGVLIKSADIYINGFLDTRLVIEMVACQGMPVGKTTFETVKWIGRFQREAEHLGMEHHEVYRKDIKMHFCQSMKAKDSNIRQALIDRFGEPGTKKNPGLLYGVKKDIWSALAIAVYFSDTNNNGVDNE